MKNKECNTMPDKKLKRIMAIISISSTVIVVIVPIIASRTFNIPTILCFPCILIPYILILNAIIKMLKRSKYQSALNILEKEIQKEEENKKERKPSISTLTIATIGTLFFAITNFILLAKDIHTAHAKGQGMAGHIPELIILVTITMCAICLLVIVLNVFKGKVFDKINSRAISAIGWIVLISTIVQSHYWESTSMVTTSTSGFFLMLLGTIIIFFGSLFNIAIKYKEEQDLTI